METEESLKNDYHSNLQKLEEKEDELAALTKKNSLELDDLSDRIRFFLRDLTLDNEYMEKSLHHLEHLKEESHEILNYEKKKVQTQINELDDNFYQALNQLTTN